MFLLQQAIVPRAVEFSRNRAILNAAPFIADIEQHRAERQTYPASLLSVWKDLERTRGYYDVRDTPHAHWKYFWFD